MAQGQSFPIFITARSDPDQRAFDEFVTKAADAGKRASNALSQSMAGVKDTIAQALSIPRNTSGSLDLQITQLRQMETEMVAVVRATREYAQATKDAAMASESKSRAQFEEIRAAFELSRVEASNLAQLRAKISVFEQVQATLNETASSTDLVIGKNNELVRSLQEVGRAADLLERSQRNVNTLSAPGLDPFRAAKNNGATTSALTDLFNQQEAAEKLRQEMGLLRKAEADAAESARLLGTIHRNTGIDLQGTAKSARDSASAFELMFQAMDAKSAANGQRFFNTALGIDQVAKSARASAAVFEEMFAAEEKAARAAQDHAAAAAQLRAQLDPTVAMQQRFDAELSRADGLLEAGAISQREYANAVAFARQQLAENYQALFRQEEVLKRGTDAYGIHTQSLRGSRVAMIQTGQQLQDMAIQFQMGTRASTVFSQQIPQLLFALTSLEGSANKTANKVGSFATLLSGPWSIAVVAGAALLGGLIDKFLLSGDAADKGGSAVENLANKLDLSKNSYESLIAVVEEYNTAQSKSTALTYDAIIAAEKKAKANLKEAETKLIALEALAQEIPTGKGAGEGVTVANSGLITKLRADVEKLKGDVAEANIAAATERSKKANDPRYAIGVAYDRELVKWQEKRKQNLIDEATLTRVNIALEQRKKKALEDYDAAHRKSSSSGSGLYGREIDSATAKQIARGAGFQVNSATRPTWIRDERPGGGSSQEQLYDAWVAAGRPSDNPVARPGTSAHERGNALDIQFGPGVTPESIKKAYAAEGVRLTKILKERGHFHIEWSTKGADKVEREAEKIADFGAEAAEKIQRINEAFDEQPRLIDRANQATRELDATIAELSERKPEGYKQLIADAEKAKATVQDSLVRPFRELREESEKRLTVETLLTQGREDEARALQEIWRLESQLGPLSEQRKAEVLATVRHEREVNEELRVRQEIIGQYLDATRSVRQELVSIFSGEGSLSNLNKIFKNLQANVLVEKLFGGALRDFDKWIKGQSGLGDSIDYFASETDRGAGAVKTFADVVLGQADRVRSGIAGGSLQSQFDAAFPAGGSTGFFGATGSVLTGWLQAVNDNTTELVVTGKRLSGVSKSIDTNLSPDEWARKLSRTLGDGFADALGISSPTGRNVLSGALYGQTLGGRTGGIIGALSGLPGVGSFFGQALGGLETANIVGSLSQSLGLGLNQGGTQIGSMIGSVIPGIGPLIGSIVGGVAGSGNIRRGLTTGGGALAGFAVGGPVGAAIGALLGNVIGGLFGKRPRGAAEVSNSSVNAHTNDSALTSSTNDWGSTVQQAVSRIADALGVNVGNYSIGLGRYKDYYQVSSVAGDPRLGNSYFGRDSRNAVYDGLDAEAATRAAVVAAIQNGAVAGISQASLNILKAGKDLDAALKKAVLIESIPKRLKQLTDPVGAAIDELNKQFEEMIAALKEGGASAQQFADAQKLYELERARTIKAAIEQATGSLKSLYDSLTVGNDALSLGDRKAAAQAAYGPLAARVAAGDTSAYAEFADAARTMLDIERQISGSQAPYFDLLRQVTELTKQQLDSQQVLINAASGGNNPFTGTAAGAGPANDNAAPVVAAIGDSNLLLTNINNNLITLSQQLVAAIGSGNGVITTQNLPAQVMNF